ncbi:serine hydrolase domain-containing protein [Actinomadura sp. NPDC048394]|uniref:serine hydrolase domain-containing protein n=1 Tax=Actinomadura sp. NPDC048394 TaxID=3158223 RepID=UPI0033EE3428
MIRNRRAAGGALAIGLAVGMLAGTGVPAHSATAAAGAGAGAADRSGLPAILERLTTDDGAPGALLEVRDRDGGTVLTSGVGDVRNRTPVPRDSRFRIGSVTKTFVATVVLQLVGEHRVVLDAPVERYLPGVIRGHGNDGRRITVRQLLQHTSGLPDYLDYVTPQDVLKDPLAHHDLRAMVDVALAHHRVFKPGREWKYSNTNYLVAGLLIENVTGRPYGEEIGRRIIGPLGLHATSVPGDDPAIPGPHPRGYVRPGEGAPLMDVTELNPTVAGPGGGMVSSASDLGRFMGALLDGRLLAPAQLREMMRTRPTGNADGRAYGLGLESRPLPCGGLYWGHTGDMLGFETVTGATSGGRQATVMVNLDPGGSDAQDADMETAVQTALCEPQVSGR